MRIGSHCSTSGALVNAAKKALALGNNCFQIFSSSPRMWKAEMPSDDAIAAMRGYRATHDLTPMVIHNSYLINCASADETIRMKSIAAMRGEIQRATALGAEYLVIHPGSAKDQTLESAIETLVCSLETASRGLRPTNFQLLLENTAGAGSTIGRTLEELRVIRDLLNGRLPFEVGYCLDTCHLYVAGFDIVTQPGLDQVVSDVERVLGLEHVPLIHTNDSKGYFASRLDRHANIGEGHIGLQGFRRILNHPKLRDKAFVLETPIDNEGDDQRNVDALKSLCRKRPTITKRSS